MDALGAGLGGLLPVAYVAVTVVLSLVTAAALLRTPWSRWRAARAWPRCAECGAVVDPDKVVLAFIPLADSGGPHRLTACSMRHAWAQRERLADRRPVPVLLSHERPVADRPSAR